MRWETILNTAKKKVYELWHKDKYVLSLTYNPSAGTARIESSEEKRLFVISKEGLLRNKTILRNEYGFRVGNEKSVYVGLILYSIGMFLFAIASQGWMMFAFLLPYCLGGIAGPALQAIIPAHVPPNEQGELQGALTFLMSATSIVGPPLMTGLFAYFTHNNAPVYFPGVSFLLGGILMLASAFFAYHALKTEKKVLA